MESAQKSASLLDLAQPHLLDGVVVRETSPGELCVGLRTEGRYAVLPVNSREVLPLLDGKHRLAEIIAQRWSQGNRIAHDALFFTVVALWQAKLLHPLEPKVESFLKSQQSGALSKKLLRLLNFRLLIPWVVEPQNSSSEPEERGGSPWLFPLVLFLLGLSGLLLLLNGTGLVQGHGGFLGVNPVRSLLWIFAGLSVGLSVRSLVRAFWLRRGGGRISGIGLEFSLWIPHLGLGLEDVVFLPLPSRMRLHAQSLGAMSLVMGLFFLGSFLVHVPSLLFVGLGVGLVLLFHSCPVVNNDLGLLLGTITGIGDLATRSARFLLMRLASGVFRRGAPAPQEKAVLVTASLGLVHLFVSGFLLFKLALSCADVFLWIIAGGKGSALEVALAIAVVVAVWLGLFGILSALLVAVVMALAQMTRPAFAHSLPTQVAAGVAMPMEELTQELSAIPPFSAFPPSLIKGLLETGKLEHYQAGAFVVRQGESGSTCYVVRSGQLGVFVRDAFGEDVQALELEPGTLFGELALLEGGIRAASVKALLPTEVLRLEGESFLELVCEGTFSAEEVATRIRIHSELKSHPIFRWVHPLRLAKLLGAIELCRFETGATILRQGEEGDRMYLIHEGQVEVSRGGVDDKVRLGPGQVFGEMAVLERAPRVATVTAVGDTALACIPGDIARDVLSHEFSAGLLIGKEMTRRRASALAGPAGRSQS